MNKLRTIGKAILDNYPHGFFSLDQIAEITKFPRKLVSDTLFIFSQEGLIKKIKKQRKEHIPGHSPRFSLIYRANRKSLAARIAPRLKEETVQDRMWKVIREKRQFNLRDLIVLAGVKRGMARWYLKALRGLGIIQPSRTGGGIGVEWRLTSDPGVKRPYVRTERKGKGGRMNNKEAPKGGITKRDRRISIWLSKADVEFVKKEASKFDLSSSAYIRMLMYKHAGFDERTARKKACGPSS
jgi:hypothetical protein